MTANVIPLKSKIERWAARIRETQAASADGIIEVGRQLLQAKADCSHGEWGELTGQTTGKPLLPFSDRAAQRLMRIARNPSLSNAAHGPHLPASWRTLAVLAALDPDDIEAAIADGRIHPEMERKDAEALVKGGYVTESEAVASIGKAAADSPLWAAALGGPVPTLQVVFVGDADPDAPTAIQTSTAPSGKLADGLREAAELSQMLDEAAKNRGPRSLVNEAWEPIMATMHRLYGQIEGARDLPKCNPANKADLLKLGPPIQRFLADHME